MARNPFVVIQKVATSIQDQLAPVDLGRLGMVRRMTLNEIDPGDINEIMGKISLLGGDPVTEILTPVNGSYDDVTRMLQGMHLRRDALCGRPRQIRQ